MRPATTWVLLWFMLFLFLALFIFYMVRFPR
jgi:hypothetical protein